jgi:signal transduction histidine kinase
LRTDGYAPHGYCILWQPSLLWFHVGSDLLIGFAYVAIAVTLAYLVYRARNQLPFHWVLLAFGAFIIACGGTHFIEVWTFWTPVYWLSGYVKLITAIASVATAVMLPPLVPKTLALVNNARLAQERQQQLVQAHADLEQLYAQVKALDGLKTQFFANVSHELRTPLTLILGPAEQLGDAATLSPQQRELVHLIERNSRLLLRQVNDLLDVAKLDADQLHLSLAPVDLATLLRMTLASFDGLLAERALTLHVDSPEILVACVDAARTQQILVNLISNAIKFTPEGGRLRCGLRLEGDRCVIVVEDSGPGVPLDQREAIFERFRQLDGGADRRFGGTGLGLPIARSLVELHGGQIGVGDSPLGGAAFEVVLPRGIDADVALPTSELPRLAFELPEPTPELALNSPAQADGAAPLVLIVEDNAEMRGFLVATLGDSYRTATAEDGRRGLEQALALRPDLILTDAMMPGMTGDQLVQALRAHAEFDDVPIVVLTARADDERRAAALRSGAQDYLVKPFGVVELRARLANLLSMKRARDVLRREVERGSEDVALLAEELAARQRQLEAVAHENARLYQEAQSALRMREEFFAIAAHELKTPLTTLGGTAQLLERRATRDGDLPERHQRAIRLIAEQCERLSRLVEQFLDLSRIERNLLTIERQPLELGELLRREVELLRPTLEQHELQLEIDAEPLSVEGDVLRLEQVVHHLLSNALKYSPDGGTISVRAGRQAGRALVEVRDQGIGIPAEALPRLFERFFRAPNTLAPNIGGLGIGLYMARTIVQLHGGTINVVSVEGQGSSFTVTLPLASDAS